MSRLTDVRQKGETCGRMPRLALRSWSSGFTMVELVVVMILVGILAVVAMPKMASINFYNTVGFADRVKGAVRYAQKQAIAKRRNVCVSVDATGSSVSFTYASAAGSAAACNTSLTGPAGQNPYAVAAERTGAAIAPVSLVFGFDALGRPFDTATFVPLSAVQVITVTGDTAIAFSVEPETGYVHT